MTIERTTERQARFSADMAKIRKTATSPTPGPWTTKRGYYGTGARANVIVGPDGEDIAHLQKVMWATEHAEEVLRMQANARLIAAAPELKAGLQDMLNNFGADDTETPFIVRARAALAHAKGA